MEILSPKQTAEELAKMQVATAPEEPSELEMGTMDEHDIERDQNKDDADENDGLSLDDEDLEEDEPLDGEGLAKEDTDFRIKEEDEK